jgi:alpha-amylase
LCAGGVVTHKDLGTYIHAVTFTLAQDYGFTRVMSSYYFEENTDRGPPFYDDGYYS